MLDITSSSYECPQKTYDTIMKTEYKDSGIVRIVINSFFDNTSLYIKKNKKDIVENKVEKLNDLHKMLIEAKNIADRHSLHSKKLNEDTIVIDANSAKVKIEIDYGQENVLDVLFNKLANEDIRKSLKERIKLRKSYIKECNGTLKEKNSFSSFGNFNFLSEEYCPKVSFYFKADLTKFNEEQIKNAEQFIIEIQYERSINKFKNPHTGIWTLYPEFKIEKTLVELI